MAIYAANRCVCKCAPKTFFAQLCACLAVRWRRCSRQRLGWKPCLGERALPASQQIGNLGPWEVSRGALHVKIFLYGSSSLIMNDFNVGGGKAGAILDTQLL